MPLEALGWLQACIAELSDAHDYTAEAGLECGGREQGWSMH